MGIKLERKKKRSFLVSLVYRLSALPFASKEKKLRLFLNLEWIFDRLALEYSYKIYKPEEHPSRQFTKSFLLKHIEPGFSVLDLGSNSGDLSNIVAEKAKRVVGIDFDESLVNEAKRKNSHPNLEFHHGEAYQFLETNKDKFDVLLLSHILEHLDDPKDFLNKFSRFFDYIYIELPDFDKTYLNQYRKRMNLPLIYTDQDHINEYDRHELKKLVNDCRMEIIDSEYMHGLQKLWCKVIK
jgi:ubiquinone/menaquinone biosynthesis C-methylase UbiE